MGNTMTMLEAALDWAARGKAIFPVWWRLESGKCACGLPLCDHPGKHPRVASGFHAATSNPQKVAEWWTRWPEANIGIATGKVSGLIVLDVDEQSGVDSINSVSDPIPDTYTVVTQRGGLHLYFEAPTDIEVRSRVRFLPGLDLRGDGGYVVAPPSRGYEVADARDPAPFGWLHKLLRHSVFSRIAKSKGPMQIPKRIPIGQRHEVLFKYASRLQYEGVEDDEIYERVTKLNEERCVPPEDEATIILLVEDVCERYSKGTAKEHARYDEMGLVDRIRMELACQETDSISTRDEHWFYDNGVWVPLGDDGVAAFLHAWKDEVYHTSDDKVKTFRPTVQKITSTSNHLRLIENRSDFFDVAPKVVAFANCVVLSDGSSAEHSPKHRLRFSRPEDYDPHASYELWDAFLDATFAGPDCEAKKAVLQEFAGAALFGAATRYAKAMILLGPGANGKSVILKVLEGLMPPGSITSVAPHNLGDQYRKAALSHSLLNIISEVPARELRETEPVKAAIDGSAMEAREIYKSIYTFRPIAAHLLAANMLPEISDFTLGFRRRWLILTCPNSVPEEEQIPDLGGKLLDFELRGIVRWAVEGMIRLTRRGYYTRCKSSEREVMTWLRSSDPVADFVDECCELDDDLFTLRLAIYHKFALWCSTTGRKRQAKRHFLKRFGHYVEKAVLRGDHGFKCQVERVM